MSGALWQLRCRKSAAHVESKIVQTHTNTTYSDHFWKLRCSKSERRCGAKHIFSQNGKGHTTFGPLLGVAMVPRATTTTPTTTTMTTTNVRLRLRLRLALPLRNYYDDYCYYYYCYYDDDYYSYYYYSYYYYFYFYYFYCFHYVYYYYYNYYNSNYNKLQQLQPQLQLPLHKTTATTTQVHYQ